jgi:hypothetical protein
MLPAASIDRTRKVWLPKARVEYVFGELQAVKPAPSRRHWKVAPASLDVKRKVGVRSVVLPDGPALIVVLGAWVSTVKV